MKFQVGDKVRVDGAIGDLPGSEVLAVGSVGDKEVIQLSYSGFYLASDYELVSRPKRYTIGRYNYDNDRVVAMGGAIVVASVYIGRPYAAKTIEEATAMLRAAMAAAPGDWVEEK